LDFEPSDKLKALSRQLQGFMDSYVYPAEPVYEAKLELREH